MAYSQCGVVVMNRTFCPENHANFSVERNSMLRETTFEVIMELYVISLLCVIGIFGNVVSIIVLRKDKERREALFLLQALAIADGMYVITAIFRYPLKYLITNKEVYVTMQLYVFPLLKTFQTITIWMMVLVTVDRYVYVCKPLHAQQLFTRRNRRLLSITIFIAGILYNIPRFMDSCIMKWYDTCTNHTISRMVYAPPFNSAMYFDIYQYALYISLLYVMPLLSLAIMNYRLIRAIHHSRRRQQARNQQLAASHHFGAHHHPHIQSTPSYSENNATLVLIIIVLVFIICESPELIGKLVTVIDRHVTSAELFSSGLVRFTTVNEVLMVINSSINFVIYVAFGKRFRHIMKETFKYLSFSNNTTMTHESVPLNANHHLKIIRK